MLNVDLTPVEMTSGLGGVATSPLGGCGGSAEQGTPSTAGSSARQLDLDQVGPGPAPAMGSPTP